MPINTIRKCNFNELTTYLSIPHPYLLRNVILIKFNLILGRFLKEIIYLLHSIQCYEFLKLIFILPIMTNWPQTTPTKKLFIYLYLYVLMWLCMYGQMLCPQHSNNAGIELDIRFRENKAFVFEVAHCLIFFEMDKVVFGKS